MLRRRHSTVANRFARRAVLNAVQSLEARRLLAVNIEFDYSLDTGNFFDDDMKAVLQLAANTITSGMTDSLSAITPNGSNTWSVTFPDPTTGNNTTIVDPSIPADTIRIYVGARDLGGNTLGRGGPAGYSGSGSPGWINTFTTRGQAGVLDEPPTDFVLAVGALAFDTDSPWNFSADINDLDGGENDFLSVATHEILHALGIGTAASWTALIDNNAFTGPKSTALYGSPVPTEPDGDHFAEGTTIGGIEVVMDPSITAGTRKTMTSLDFAALADIGWAFDPFVQIFASDSDAGEPDGTATFVLQHNGPTNANVLVDLQIGGAATRGTDYVLSINGTPFVGDTVTIPSGSSFVEIQLTVIDDLVAEGDEDVAIAVLPGAGYNVAPAGSVESILIADNDIVVSVSAIDDTASEPRDGGRYRITRAGSIAGTLTVNFAMSGSAKRGGDYLLQGIDSEGNFLPVPGNAITIPAGDAFVDVHMEILDDGIVENTEIATLTITAGNYNIDSAAAANVTIFDDDRRPSLVNQPVGKTGTSNLSAGDLNFSANGRYATFVSNSTELVSSPLTTYYQVYRRDLHSGVNMLVSVAAGGKAEANGDAARALVSADGRYIVYETTANNIINGRDTNLVNDVYWRDLVTNETVLISTGGGSALGGSLVGLSPDGQRVLFTSTTRAGLFVKGVVDKNNTDDLFVWNHRTGRTDVVSVTPDGNSTGNRSSAGSDTVGEASFNWDGSTVLFPSRASNLVAGVNDGNVYEYDLFVRVLNTGRTEMVSISQDGVTGGDGASGYGKLSADGSKIVFRSAATDLVSVDQNDAIDIFVRDRTTGTTKVLTLNPTNTDTAPGEVNAPDMTSDGRFVVFSTTAGLVDIDTNGLADIYRIEVATGAKTLVSINAAGTNGGGSASLEARINIDGSVVVFTSLAADLAGDFDKTTSDYLAVYTRNLNTGENIVTSLDGGNNPAGAHSYGLVLSYDGTRVGYFSDSRSLAKPDNNNVPDMFMIDTPFNEPIFVDAFGKLIIRGSPIDDVINVQRVGTKIVAKRNDLTLEFKTQDITGIDIFAGDGDDTVTLGNNLTVGAYISAGWGNDRVQGGSGNDTIQGGPGRDFISGGEGDDVIDGGKGNDTVNGDGGKDRLRGGDGADLVNGGGGADRIFDGLGNDTYMGGTGNDRFYAGVDGSIDTFLGNAGADILSRIGGSIDAGDLVDSIETTV